MLKMANRLLLLLILLLPVAARAESVGIVATVNSDIITSHELQQRVEIIIAANSMPHTDEVRHDITPEVLRGLIDDKLRLQAANLDGIKVTDEDIRKGISTIAGQNNMSVDKFLDELSAQGIEKATLEDQIRAQISWQKYVEQKIVPNADVPPSEVDRLQTQMKNASDGVGYSVAEIYLPVEDPSEADKVKAFGDDLIKQLANGANFASVARSFSASASASRGGDLGWQTLEQMPPEIARIIKVMKPGQVSKPMQTLRGYYILYLRDTRTLDASSIPDREKLHDVALQQQIDLLQRRELRDLRNKAFIEVK
jgi:peptidyl-prolyl cis-trans isomerase SurA